jgi:competence ComEA-like helix-hairpin-helix protein
MSHCIFVIMNLNKEPIKNWFGFSRRERRATFILLLLVVVIIGLRYTVPESRIDIEDITATLPVTGNYSEISANHNTGTKLIRQTVVKKSVPKRYIIDINTSDSATLVRLPGIGPVLSARIIKYRHLLGGYASIEQLKEVYGLPIETFEKIRSRVFADSTVVEKININSAGYKELSRLPYFEKYEVTAILKYRELKGRINWITDLTENKLITVEKAKKVGPYLKYEE